MDVKIKFKALRVNLRRNSKKIMEDVAIRHIPNLSPKNNIEICIFCGSLHNITKEHVLPKWTFEKCPNRFFTTGMNGIDQTYNKTTIPVCANCNNNLLANIESYIISIFSNVDLTKSMFTNEELENVIRWFEIIDYKFQMLEVRRKFIKSKSSVYIPFLANIPVSVMRNSIDFSPSKALTETRVCLKRVTIKSKIENLNSLLVFKTKNESFHFFHQMNNYIFLELPQYKIALFYFYTRQFSKSEDAYQQANKILSTMY